jgi:outer membrane protein
MKMKILACIVTLVVVGIAHAQDLKIGYTNAEYLLGLLPEARQIEADLNAYETQLQNQLQAKYQELQTKVGDYQANESSYNDLIKADKQRELTVLQESLQKFQADAEQSLINKRNQLLQPAVEKIGTAIQTVAEENGYTHVLSAGSPGFDVLLYAKEEYDISNLVLAKLGIDPPTGN